MANANITVELGEETTKEIKRYIDFKFAELKKEKDEEKSEIYDIIRKMNYNMQKKVDGRW